MLPSVHEPTTLSHALAKPQITLHDSEKAKIKPLAIDLSENMGLKDKGIELFTLAFADEAVGLQRLMLSSVGMTAKGFIHLCRNGLSKTTSLTALDVSNCQWNHGLYNGNQEINASDSVLQCCRALCVKSHAVTEVDSDFPAAKLNPEDVRFHSVLSKNIFLRTLCLANCSITVDGVQMLAFALRECPALEELDLSYNPFGDDGVMQVANSLLWRAEGQVEREEGKGRRKKAIEDEEGDQMLESEKTDQALGRVGSKCFSLATFQAMT